MVKVKTSIYVNMEVWEKFKGTLRDKSTNGRFTHGVPLTRALSCMRDL